MKLKNFVENHERKNMFILALIDLKSEIKEDIVFVMRAKTHI